MKILKNTVSLFSCFFLIFQSFLAFGQKGVKNTPVAQIQEVTKEIDTATSVIQWKGTKKLINDFHEGTLQIASGSIKIIGDDQLDSGNVVIDMKTISSTDLKGEYKGKLEGHLKNSDFFDVSKYPQATFKFTKENVTPLKGKKFLIEGTMTIKERSHEWPIEISFDSDSTNLKNAKKATGVLSFDRTKFGISYNPEVSDSILATLEKKVKEKIISNTITAKLNISFR